MNLRHVPHRPLLAATTFVALATWANEAAAHVKWFSREFDFSDPPLTIAQILTPTFWLMAVLSLATIALFVLAEGRVDRASWYQRVEDWLAARASSAYIVMRVTVGAVLLLCWQAGVLFAPELTYDAPVIGWFQFALVLTLLSPKTTPIAGLGIVALYAIGVAEHGLFHMLDYFVFLGVAAYLVFRGADASKWQRIAKPALFAATGFSLCWLSMEKLVFPQWGLLLLRENPALTLGLPAEFFLVGAAFVEFSLGFLLIIGLLSRPLALVITLVFFLTTMVFGKDEMIGHSILHGVLVVFMLEGTSGALRPPIHFHSKTPLRIAFATVNLALAFAVFLVPYRSMAVQRSMGSALPHAAMAHGNHPQLMVSAEDAPTVALEAEPASDGGWDLTITTTGIAFSKKDVGTPHAAGSGHVHLYVDGRSYTQVFESTFHLEPLGPGQHTVTAELGTNDHRVYATEAGPIRASIALDAESADDLEFTEDDLIYFEPLTERMDVGEAPSEALVDLGRALYYETQLSMAGDLSCNSCHLLDRYGVDNEKTSPGHLGKRGARNSPTVYNAAYGLAQFWDGRAADVEEQAKGPILNPVEMAMPDERVVVKRLNAIPKYGEAFRAAFEGEKDPITYDNMAKAIGAFERGLTTPSRFDAFLAGDHDALDADEKKGLRTFLDLGCATCHNGPAIGGRSYQRVGLVVPYPDDEDLGRFDVTKDASDRQRFKVPSLRNIAKTAPYFHNGRYEHLEDAVKTMALYQLGKTISDDEIDAVVAFLNSLTGELPTAYIAPR